MAGSGAGPSFVEGMGRWLGWTDAIRLAAALQAGGLAERGPAAPHRNPATGTADQALPLERELARMRAAWARSIDALGPPAPNATRRRAVPARQDPGMVTDDDYAAHRRRYLELQQSMEQGVATLREQARRAATAAGAALAALAALDAAMAEVVGPREQAVLATLPGLLQGYFEKLQQQHAETPWLDRFRADMQRVLHAELELRLQPVLGLIEALRSTSSREP